MACARRAPKADRPGWRSHPPRAERQNRSLRRERSEQKINGSNLLHLAARGTVPLIANDRAGNVKRTKKIFDKTGSNMVVLYA